MTSQKKYINGTLKTILLALLKENGKMYGYEICQLTKKKTNNDILLTEGAIYPSLHQLEKQGLICSTKEIVNGRTRKYYALNLSSVKEVDREIDMLKQFTHHLRTLLSPST